MSLWLFTIYPKFRKLDNFLNNVNFRLQNVLTMCKSLQWNPVNTTTFGPWKIGRINGVVVRLGCTVLPSWNQDQFELVEVSLVNWRFFV